MTTQQIDPGDARPGDKERDYYSVVVRYLQLAMTERQGILDELGINLRADHDGSALSEVREKGLIDQFADAVDRENPPVTREVPEPTLPTEEGLYLVNMRESDGGADAVMSVDEGGIRSINNDREVQQGDTFTRLYTLDQARPIIEAEQDAARRADEQAALDFASVPKPAPRPEDFMDGKPFRATCRGVEDVLLQYRRDVEGASWQALASPVWNFRSHIDWATARKVEVRDV